MSAELRNRKRLERLRQQADALLALTQAINRNVEDAELFGSYREVLESMGVGKLALFCLGENVDAGWDCMVSWGYPKALPRLSDAESALSGKSHAIVADDTEVEFDLAIPVEHDSEVIAYVIMGDREEGRGMSPSVRYVRFITTLTNVLVVALRNRAMAAERIRTAGLERELALAGEMQTMLLPRVLPDDDHRSFAARYRPHYHVGGDYYDAVKMPDGRMAIAIADVSGKGMPAAFLMSNFQAHLHAMLDRDDVDLETMVRQLNDRVFSSAGGERFITFFLASTTPAREPWSMSIVATTHLCLYQPKARVCFWAKVALDWACWTFCPWWAWGHCTFKREPPWFALPTVLWSRRTATLNLTGSTVCRSWWNLRGNQGQRR